MHVIEFKEVLGADLPCRIEANNRLDAYMNLVADRPLMER